MVCGIIVTKTHVRLMMAAQRHTHVHDMVAATATLESPHGDCVKLTMLLVITGGGCYLALRAIMAITVNEGHWYAWHTS